MTSAAPQTTHEHGPDENFVRRWIIDPWRYFWLGVTAPSSSTSKAPGSGGATGFVELTKISDASQRVIESCRAAHPDDACDWDVLAALLAEDDLAPLWAATNTNLDALRSDVDRELRALTGAERRVRPTLQRTVQGALMHSLSAGKPMRPRDLLVRVWRGALSFEDDPLAETIAMHIDGFAMVTFFAHGVASVDDWTAASAPEGANLVVGLVNDDFTTRRG